LYAPGAHAVHPDKPPPAVLYVPAAHAVHHAEEDAPAPKL